MKRLFLAPTILLSTLSYADFVNDGRAAYQDGDYKNAVHYWRKACDANSAAGCSNLAMSYFRGEGVEKDTVKARSLFKKACDMSDEGSCMFYDMIK